MTYCLGVKVREGLVCLSDGRITSGTQVTNAYKSSLLGPEGAEFCVMTSGLRSLRDKTLAYLERQMRGAQRSGYESILDAVDGYCQALRQVAEEDRTALEDSNLTFNLHAIIGGQLGDDPEPNMYLVYPEANWITIGKRTPYLSIGATAYGKPILDRALRYETSLKTVLKLAYLSFDSTRTSTADVGFPLDMMSYVVRDRRWRQVQYEQDDLSAERKWWNENITELARRMPDGPWAEALIPQDPGARLQVVPED